MSRCSSRPRQPGGGGAASEHVRFMTRGELCEPVAVCLLKSLSPLNLSAGEVLLRATRMDIDPHCQLLPPGTARPAGPGLYRVSRAAGRVGGSGASRASESG